MKPRTKALKEERSINYDARKQEIRKDRVAKQLEFSKENAIIVDLFLEVWPGHLFGIVEMSIKIPPRKKSSCNFSFFFFEIAERI